MAVNLLRCLKQRSILERGEEEGARVENWWPEYDIDGDWVTLTEINVRSKFHALHTYVARLPTSCVVPVCCSDSNSYAIFHAGYRSHWLHVIICRLIH